MGNRRMFNKTIVSSARFLKMPTDSQYLYFQLGMNADDDGIVEAFTVMRHIGSNEDNLKLLATKGFVKVLNEDLVTYILDWQEHNKLRADRKIDSIYKELLVQILPEIKLLEAKKRSDRAGRTWDGHGTEEDKLSKDKLSKFNIIKDSIIDYLNSKANKKFTYNNKSYNSNINARLQDGFSLEDFKKIIDNKCQDKFFIENDYLNPDTLFRPKNFEKYLNEQKKDGIKSGGGIEVVY